MPDRQPTYLDLFSGCGGLSLGFREAGFRPLLALDSDPHAVACYNFNHQGDGIGAVKADLGAFQSHGDVAAFLASHGIAEADCDVLVGGPPCQSFSLVGRTKVRALMDADEKMRKRWEEQNARRTMLFEAYVLFLEYLQPRWFLFENVPAIKSHAAFRRIEARFNNLRTPTGARLSYAIDPDNYWASDFGVPQQRRRFLMVGHRAAARIQGWTRPVACAAPTVADALDDLPTVPNGHRKPELPYPSGPVTDYQKLMRRGPSGQPCETVYNHVGRRHNSDDVVLFGLMGVGARFSDPAVQKILPQINPNHKLLKYSVEKFQDKLHKLNPDRPAWTVTAHLQKDCYKFIHHSQPRTITVREAARLQSFPDGFVFPDSLGPAYRLIGNAVPPLMAAAFARSFRASDPGLDSSEARVCAIISDHVWQRICLLVADRALPKHYRLKKAVASAFLAFVEGRTASDAARILGDQVPQRIERLSCLLQKMRVWSDIEPILRYELATQPDENLGAPA